MTDDNGFTDQFSPLLNIKMTPVEFEDVWADISREIKSKKPQGSIRRHRSAFRTGAAASVAAVVAVAIGGTLVYRAGSMPSGSHAQNRTQTNSAMPVPEPSSPFKSYYMKNLGFQPMSPSYIPSGWSVARSTLKMSNNDGQYGSSFSLELDQKSSSAEKFAADRITIEEGSSAQTSNVQFFHSTKTTIRQQGLTITVYASDQWRAGAPAPQNVNAIFNKHGIHYMVTYAATMKKTITTDEFIKILESLTIPEQHRPNEVDVSGFGKLSAARKVLKFKLIVPSFIPAGFNLGTGTDRPYGATFTTSGVPPTPSNASATSGGTQAEQSYIDLTYKNGKASIGVHEDYDVPDNKNVPSGGPITIQGHQVHLKEEKYPGYIAYVYQWYDAATHVFYDVEGSDPSRQGLVDKAIMDKVVASMLG